ncbi:MAG: LysE family translocator [Pseudomonadota bacterium]
METSTLAALAGFAFAGAWTPGPNNMMLAASGATHGWRATVPHAMGVALGFPTMVFVIAIGLGEVFEASATLRDGLSWLGAGVMLWLAWRIATAKPPAEERGMARGVTTGGETGTASGTGTIQSGTRPFSFIEAAAFQWVNPKAWVMCIGVAATFASGAAPLLEAAIAAGVFAVAGLTSTQAWTAFGAAIGRLLGRGTRLRVFNALMGVLLAASALWLVIAPAQPPV